MSLSTRVPVIVDVDNGYGSDLGAARVARELAYSSVAGMCIEDTAFPKSNSLLGEQRPSLLQPREFATR